MLPVLCAAAFLGILSSMALGPFLPFMATELGVPVGALGQVPAATMLIGAVLGLVIGPLADHYGERRTLVAGALAVFAGALATAGAIAPAVLVITAVCGGLARASLLPVTLATVSGRLSGAAQRRGVSLVSASVSVSAIAGVPVLTAIAAAYGWRAAFIAIAAAALLIMLLMRTVLRPDARHAPSEPARALGLGQILAMYAPLIRASGARGVQGIILSVALRNCMAWGFLTYIGAFLAEQHQLGAREIGWAFLASGAGHFSGSLLIGGRIAPQGGPPLRAAFALLHLVGAILFGAGFVLPLPTLAAVAVLTAAACFTGGADVVTTRLLVAETPAGRATTLTLNGSGSSIGGAIGGSLGGVLLSVSGFAAVGAMVFIAGLAAAAVAWLSRPIAAPAAGDKPLPYRLIPADS